MRGRRRGGAGSAVSLFSFQDILTAVIGIMLMLVMLLATELSMVSEIIQASQPIDEQRDVLSKEVGSAEEDVRSLKERLDDLIAKIERASTKGRVPLIEQIARTRSSLKRTLQQREAMNREIEHLWEDIASSELGGIADRVSVRNELRMQVDGLRGELDELARSNRLTYRISQGHQKRPIILIASETRFRIGGAGNEQRARDLMATDMRARLALLRALLSQHSPVDRYVLIVAKPSISGPDLQELFTLVESIGFEVGFDLVPESWSVLIGGNMGETEG